MEIPEGIYGIMKISTRILLTLLVITAITICSSLFVRHFIVIPELIELEAKADRKDIERLTIGFDMVRHSIQGIAYDYALWDDSYYFLLKRNDNYIINNYVIDTFISNEINIALLADKQDKVIWSRQADLSNEVFLSDSPFDINELAPYIADAKLAFPNAPISKSGIVNTRQGPLIFASFSVLKSDESGSSPGSLLFARFIDDTMLADINEMVKLNFTIDTVKEEDINIIKNMSLANTYRQNNTVEWYVYDLNDMPIIKLIINLDERTFSTYLLSKPMITVILVLLISWLIVIARLNFTLARPIKKIVAHLSTIRKTENYSLRLNNQRKDEIGLLANECDRLLRHIQHQQTVVKRQSSELEKLSYEDSLTGLANRRRFDEELETYLAISKRKSLPLSLIMCDIDHFKLYNDNYGHQQGDLALAATGKALKNSIRRKTDIAARYGGEEFTLILLDTDLDGAKAVARRLIQLIANEKIKHSQSPTNAYLSISAGIAVVNDSIDSAGQLIQQADKALYRAKESGRNRVAF
jgi:diguanylate cyclase (GGDEF)-like protein